MKIDTTRTPKSVSPSNQNNRVNRDRCDVLRFPADGVFKEGRRLERRSLHLEWFPGPNDTIVRKTG
jgi:hypothetical protein